MTHRFTLRVYYEDTDLAGIVYYANYLKFIERARSEWVRELGIDQQAMKRDSGRVFAVRRIEADYLSPAYFDDVIEVRSAPIAISPARITLRQEVFRSETRLFAALATLVCLDAKGRPQRLPQALAGLADTIRA
ncbi:tol-pal system-associated acyl-CoA thioesterase [Pararhodobacter sp.]|uniref:tol-pal system-associated acyl-CoA thioesterase n=1 Tax=Pararhodobacter sp. TaxID=2127056 RepID=UPI002FDD8AB8